MTTLCEEALAYIHRNCGGEDCAGELRVCSAINPVRERMLLDMAAWALGCAEKHSWQVEEARGSVVQVYTLRSMASALRGDGSEKP